MSSSAVQEPPLKKRRFFVEQSPEPEPVCAPSRTPQSANAADSSINETSKKPPSNGDVPEQVAIDGANESPEVNGADGFDKQTFEAFVGTEVPAAALQMLKKVAGDSIERAINMYLDGSWKTASPKPPAQVTLPTSDSRQGISEVSGLNVSEPSPPTANGIPQPARMPEYRYVGAFGVEAWSTKSGTGLISHGETIKIERTKIKPPVKLGRGGRVIPPPKLSAARMRVDVIVRFTNRKGEEVGRLSKETADWVSPLMDQKVCRFEGTCVYAPDRIRVNDTIYLQLRCSMLRLAFESANFVKPEDNNRTTGFLEEKETSEEKDLRLRQVALVKLFDEINLHPATLNATTAKHKRQGILEAAEIAEQYDKSKEEKPSSTPPEGGSSQEEAEDGKELEQDQLDSLYKKAQSFDFDTPVREPVESFAMDLRKYQKQALHWMIGKEKNEKSDHKEVSMHPLWEQYKWPLKDMDDQELPRVIGQDSFYVNPYSGELTLEFPVQEQDCLGGILADEMGLGKTIEMLSLIHSHKSDAASQAMETSSSATTLPRLPKNSSVIRDAPCTTLVVAPMSLLAQWQSEAEKASRPGTLKTIMYYGSEKAVSLQNLCCEANVASAPNLIITSYGVILSEINQIQKAGGNKGAHGGLFSLNFFRIILDEAHFVKNRQSKTAKACYELSAQHRWVLTGTPIVNRLEDLFSLVRFLRVEPWSNFSFWKTFITMPFESKDFIRALDVVQTVLEPLVLRRTKDMKTPDGEALVPLPPRIIEVQEIELSQQEREVYDYIYMRAKRTFDSTMEAGTVLKSYSTIFAQILRLRQSCCHPVLTRNKAIVADEEDAAAAVDIANGLADDMDLQALIERFTSDSQNGEQDITNKFGAHVLQQIQSEAGAECPICSEEPMIGPAVTGCWHSACTKCLLEYIEHQRSKHTLPLCFNCREPINQRDIFEVVRHPLDDDDDLYSTTPPGQPSKAPRISLRRIGSDYSSAKIAALVSHLKNLRTSAPGTKSVVFSQFTSFLDLIEPALTRAGIPHLRFDGAMNQKARAAVLTQFDSANTPDISQASLFTSTSTSTSSKQQHSTVLLLSLRAGGVGLNLTSARRVFMMDPWWSFAVEAQAIDRVHRMGQVGEVRVTRFVVRESIEGRMLKVQERKKFIASSLGMMSEEEKRGQRIEDIKELLS